MGDAQQAINRNPSLSAGEMTEDQRLALAWTVAGAVADPEIPVLTIADLGVLRNVLNREGGIEVVITPTYSGCPAMHMIAAEIKLALLTAGLGEALVTTVLSPAWTTDWMSDEGKRKLTEYGIAPPPKAGGRRSLFGRDRVSCPRCQSSDTVEIAEFGSTSCKSLWRCNACLEPFDYFKCH
jgi:ring-1,2-phenylacetyl-CoA epoxidase subunit PaaD